MESFSLRFSMNYDKHQITAVIQHLNHITDFDSLRV